MRTSAHSPSSPSAIVNGSKRAIAPSPARMPARTSAEFTAVYRERASAWNPALTPSTAR